MSDAKPYKIITIPAECFGEGVDVDTADMAEIFKAWRTFKLKKAHGKLLEFNAAGEEVLQLHPYVAHYRRFTEWHVQFHYAQSILVNYYPSKGKWVTTALYGKDNKQRSYSGGFESMLNFLAKRFPGADTEEGSGNDTPEA